MVIWIPVFGNKCDLKPQYCFFSNVKGFKQEDRDYISIYTMQKCSGF